MTIVSGGGPGGSHINPTSSPEPPPFGGDGGCSWGSFILFLVVGLIGWGIWSAIAYFSQGAGQ